MHVRESESEKKKKCESETEPLTVVEPVAGKPRVMFGREGDVYRDSWLTGPSLLARRCAREG